MKGQSKALLAAVAAGAAMVGGIASATIPGDDGVIHACFQKQQGQLRLVSEDGGCRPSEEPISWNQRGPKGDPGPQGPPGPKGDPGPPGEFDNCAAAAEGTGPMVEVGATCIDRHEASIWTRPDGGTQLTSEAEIDAACPDDGQPTDSAPCDEFYARSVEGVEPARNVTWFQAQHALINSGKRLPSNAEWQAAATGTPGGDSPCNIGPNGSVEPTGASEGCVSEFGARDMVGNVAEWVADWVPASTGCTSWGSFSDDSMCLSGASETAPGPGALVRGGEFFFSSATDAGVFDVFAQHPPYTALFVLGFRGAR